MVGRRSPVALYDHGLATYDASDTFRHADAEGFVRLWGLGVGHLVGPPGPGADADGGGAGSMTLWEGRSRAAAWPTPWPDFTVSLAFDRGWPTTTWPARGPTSRASAEAGS